MLLAFGLIVGYTSYGAKIEKVKTPVKMEVSVKHLAFEAAGIVHLKLVKFDTDKAGTMPFAFIMPMSSLAEPKSVKHKNEPRIYDLAHYREGWLARAIS